MLRGAQIYDPLAHGLEARTILNSKCVVIVLLGMVGILLLLCLVCVVPLLLLRFGVILCKVARLATIVT